MEKGLHIKYLFKVRVYVCESWDCLQSYDYLYVDRDYTAPTQ